MVPVHCCPVNFLSLRETTPGMEEVGRRRMPKPRVVMRAFDPGGRINDLKDYSGELTVSSYSRKRTLVIFTTELPFM